MFRVAKAMNKIKHALIRQSEGGSSRAAKDNEHASFTSEVSNNEEEKDNTEGSNRENAEANY